MKQVKYIHKLNRGDNVYKAFPYDRLQPHTSSTGGASPVEWIFKGERVGCLAFTGIDTIRAYWYLSKAQIESIPLKLHHQQSIGVLGKKYSIRTKVLKPQPGKDFRNRQLRVEFECSKVTGRFGSAPVDLSNISGMVLDRVIEVVNSSFGLNLSLNKLYLSNYHIATDFVFFDDVFGYDNLPFMFKNLPCYKNYEALTLPQNEDMLASVHIKLKKKQLKIEEKNRRRTSMLAIYHRPKPNSIRFEVRYDRREVITRRFEDPDSLVISLFKHFDQICKAHSYYLIRFGIHPDVTYCSKRVGLQLIKDLPASFSRTIRDNFTNAFNQLVNTGRAGVKDQY
ncbi:MAG TPA: hypothetical protein ENH10_02450, partial [Bacteroidetes bacterium]|nr:hypothetical protein [Bacteroidota bacterium]HEX04000.1 hypothetical protein [Bacteroidota bacterium]